MLIARIDGATRYLGAPIGWNPEVECATCQHLAIRDTPTEGGGNVMISAWQPTPADIAAIVAGAPLYLHVWGTSHPPVWIEAGAPP